MLMLFSALLPFLSSINSLVAAFMLQPPLAKRSFQKKALQRLAAAAAAGKLTRHYYDND
jgi:hypothetical protein